MPNDDSEAIDEAYAGFLDEREQDPRASFDSFIEAQPEMWRDELRTLHALAGAVLPELQAFEPGVLEGGPERYVIEGELGAGGMGDVLRVYDRRLQRRLAMKVARHGGRRAERFFAEARVAGRLDHPGIAPVHELDVDADGRPFFTMAEVRGRTFEQLIEVSRAGREGWSLTRAVGVLVRVTDAMGYAHAKGVVHRDLKPANVMVGEFGETYVLDWGLAKAAGLELAGERRAEPREPSAREPEASSYSTPDLTTDGDVVGTPTYMAPEQARGELAAVGPLSDVYAVGCMLYQLLSGRAPYAEEPDVLSAVRERAPRALDPGADAPAELVAIAERAMQREPGARYASMGELNSDLRAYFEGRVVGAYESGGLAELRKWFGRNRRLSAALLAVVLASLAGVGATFYFRGLEEARGQRFFDLQLVREAVQEAELDLWPELPATVPSMNAWLRRNRALAARLPQHRSTLAETVDEAARLRQRERPELAGSRWTFSDPDRRWRHEQLELLVAELEMFSGSEGALEEVAGRRAWAAVVVERTVLEPAAAWELAVAQLAEDSRFEGLGLEPQVGLVPLGRDPHSLLQEFAHLRSGELPERAENGELGLDADSALVLVLLPPVEFTMGPIPDQVASMSSLAGPAHQHSLPAFFVGKHELTGEQWQRLGGEPTSPGLRPRLPARGVAWADIVPRLRSHGLDLPTEARWEVATLCGTDTAYPWGEAFEEITAYADLVSGGAQPVGQLAPNDFGLHDTIGNIAEWCLDSRAPYTGPVSGPGALRTMTEETSRAYRGVGFVGLQDRAAPLMTLPRFRLFSAAENPNTAIGFRVVRELDEPVN